MASPPGLNFFKEGYFTETGTMNPEPSVSLKVDEVLYQGESDFQRILFFRSEKFGRVLCLDNAIQCTEFDEFAYQEMISFLPLNSHENPREVLIIGGGDGGVAREVAKHPKVDKIIQCEIDGKVVELSKEFLPHMACGFASEKIDLRIGDGINFVKNTECRFDVIITDSSDPIGPAEVLYQDDYYASLNKILKPGGIVCCQGESLWFDREFIREVLGRCSKIFAKVDYSSIYIPTYPGGQIGFIMASNSEETDFRRPITVFSDDESERMRLRYYSSEIHSASFVLPRFARKYVDESLGRK
ncbi:spermidine synthase [Galendromus occidentalis]|uniref:Spermidine synthase n=1 Tax=Galendromus occidentalis TaxID=34638 RepID=A0AAJ7L6J5_9ACAR|nr:spermidine synthase [Galendromus occidentalis]